MQIIIEVSCYSRHWLVGVLHQHLIHSLTVLMELQDHLFITHLTRREQSEDRHQEALVNLHCKLLDQQLTVPTGHTRSKHKPWSIFTTNSWISSLQYLHTTQAANTSPGQYSLQTPGSTAYSTYWPHIHMANTSTGQYSLQAPGSTAYSTYRPHTQQTQAMVNLHHKLLDQQLTVPTDHTRSKHKPWSIFTANSWINSLQYLQTTHTHGKHKHWSIFTANYHTHWHIAVQFNSVHSLGSLLYMQLNWHFSSVLLRRLVQSLRAEN